MKKLLCVALSVVLGLATIRVAVAAPLEGQVLNGTEGDAPVAGIAVTLVSSNSANTVVERTQTDRKGKFSFKTDSRTASGDAFVAYFGGIRYSEPVSSSSNVRVWDTTRSDAHLVVQRESVFVDFTGAAWNFYVSLTMVNLDNRTYVGSLSGNAGSSVRMTLPAGSIDFAALHGFSSAASMVTANHITDRTPIVPALNGSVAYMYSYQIPLSGDSSTVALTLDYPTSSLCVVTSALVHVVNTTLQRTRTAADCGGSGDPTLLSWTGQNYKKRGSAIQLVLAPTRVSDPAHNLGVQPLVRTVTLLTACMIISGAAFAVQRRDKSRSSLGTPADFDLLDQH